MLLAWNQRRLFSLKSLQGVSKCNSLLLHCERSLTYREAILNEDMLVDSKNREQLNAALQLDGCMFRKKQTVSLVVTSQC